MNNEFASSQDKSAGDLGREAIAYTGHTLLAVLLMLAMAAVGFIMHISMDAIEPKIAGTVLALVIPLAGGYLVAKVRGDAVATNVWISGLVFFSIVCVWVLDLPTGPGLCEKCGAIDKLTRTFFDIEHGSGLMGGDGLLVGTWLPLSMIGYSIGAKFGLMKK
jgi:hypothetical protein